ncbi:sorbosone dehydrogenase family protein [Ideonella sp. DXS29W]|uniref:Sorbosone dehydrogenase family protein n=1 Tax=Ideonella lacteola TaxID=2984193 RepID=A0ABU9BHQ2_9BURK
MWFRWIFEWAALARQRVAMLAAMGLALSVSAAAAGGPSGTPPAGASADPGYGPSPRLPAPEKHFIPTVLVAPARPWPAGTSPVAANGLAVKAFATGLVHPRWLLVLPQGDVLVAETNAPPKPDDNPGIKGMVMKAKMKEAGAGTPSPNRITLLRDTDGDGVADVRSVLLENLQSPFGMALVPVVAADQPASASASSSTPAAGDPATGATYQLYVACTDAVWRFPYRSSDLRITAPGERLTDLPAGPINHHWTKGLIASRDGRLLYATVGSNSNVAERGLEAEQGRAAIWEIDVASGRKRIFASGLRNANGLAWEPGSGVLWTVVNERDELGDNLVPDYLTSVRDSAFYGWPWSYYGRHVDDRVQPTRTDMVERAVVPDYALGSHTASLGLTFSDGTTLPARFAHGAFIGQHGSWNREPRSGYKVVFVPFDGALPARGAMPEDVLTGFLSPRGEAYGRPVGVVLDRSGALLVADDVGNTIWRVSNATVAR